MSEYLSLKEYDRLSTQTLLKAGLPVTDHNIAFINEYMMKADMVYKDDVTGSDRQQFRYFYAQFGIKNLCTAYKKENEHNKIFKSLNVKKDSDRGNRALSWEPVCKKSNPVEDCYSKELREIVQNSEALTTKEKYVIIEHCFNSVPMAEVTNSLKAKTFYLRRSARKKLKWIESKCLR